MDCLRAPERQLVHGYLCVEGPDEGRITAWTSDITGFALQSGYTPGSIFIDRCPSFGSSSRGGFIELLAALRLPGVYAVVVPSLMHLSTDSFMQQVLVQLVRLTDSHVLVSASNGNTLSKVSFTSRAES